MAGDTPILLTSGILTSRVLSKFVKYTIPSLRVISYQEIPDDKQIKIVSCYRAIIISYSDAVHRDNLEL